MRLNSLTLGDKRIFNKYLNLKEHGLSVYNFANIYIWRKFFEINWVVIKGSLCIFFKDRIGVFLYLSPLGKTNNPEAVIEAFNILDKMNSNPEFAHLENAEEGEVGFYRNLGLECSLKSYDYLCKRDDLAQLKGNKFKSKRASCNSFARNYDFRFEKLSLDDRIGCLKLYKLWAKQRKGQNPDPVYQGMLQDSRVSLKDAFGSYSSLGFQGSVVKVGKEIKGFTFGFPLNPHTFCILFEIADLSIKGLAQFIFREFSRELRDYKYINVMDDSGLENLKKVKLSYHPVKLIPAYIVRRKIAPHG